MPQPAYSYTPRFTTTLQVEDNDGFPFKLLHPLTYVTDVDHRGTFSVPTGFLTDYASIPRVLWNVLPPVGAYDAAAVLHDFLYQTGTINLASITRAEADAILLEAMEVKKVAAWQRRFIYAGIRLGGWLTWKRYRAAEKN
jgi:hypothetical protein